MAKAERRDALASAVDSAGELDFKQIRALFPDVSEMTLRSDLRELDSERRIVRVHGGAKSIGNVVRTDDLFFRKASRNVAQKQEIAQKALRFLKPNMSVFFDCGTTMLALARILPDEKLFVVTNSTSCMPEFARLTNVEVQFLGGRLNRFNLSTFDPRNQHELDKRNFDVAFMAVTGYSIERGFSCGTEVDDELRKTAIKHADKVIVLMDSSKVGRVFPVTYARAEDVNVVVTDDGMPEETRRDFAARGVEVI